MYIFIRDGPIPPKGGVIEYHVISFVDWDFD